MTRIRSLLLVALLCLTWLSFRTSAASLSAAPNERPVIVLTAFGTSTEALETYKYIESLTRRRFPGHEIRWAFTSENIREKLRREGRKDLKSLRATLEDLKTAGVKQVAVQSLHVVPGAEWQEMLREARQVSGLQAVLGKPLLTSDRDRHRVLAALAETFPNDLEKNAVVVVGHGSPQPQGEAAYLAFEARLRSRFPGKNVFLGVVEGKPSGDAALERVKRSRADAVVFVPLMVVAGDHMKNDILGDDPDSWKSRLLAWRKYRVTGTEGLGYRDKVVAVFLDHLEEALTQLRS